MLEPLKPRLWSRNLKVFFFSALLYQSYIQGKFVGYTFLPSVCVKCRPDQRLGCYLVMPGTESLLLVMSLAETRTSTTSCFSLVIGTRSIRHQNGEPGHWHHLEPEFHLGRKSSILAITINLQYVDIYPHFQSSILKLREPCCRQTLQQFLILFNILFSHSI